MYKILATAAVLLVASVNYGQTIKVKSNSAEYLHLVVVGKDALGHKTTRVLYDVTEGYRKSISLFKEKYGYDEYNNAKMTHDATDSTNRWTELLVYDKSNTLYSTIDLTQPASKVVIGKTKTFARVEIDNERNYVITSVTISDL